MTADVDLPVWTIRPNWKAGIVETLSWLTDVLPSSYGTEQRRALRLSPRRTFEVNFNPVEDERSYFDLWLHRLGKNEFMVPLWHDNAKLNAPVAIGATSIPIDTDYREFEVGGLAIILGDDPFTFDKVEVTAIAPDSLTIAAGVTSAWGTGTSVHPLRRTRLTERSLATALTNTVGKASLEFQLNQANDLPDEGDWDVLYNGYPLLLEPPNWRQNIDLEFQWNADELDNDHGLVTVADDSGRAFSVQSHNLMIEGRAAHWANRQMLYRLRGKQGSVWLPTFNRDLELSRARLAADALIDIKKIGYSYTGGVVDGRQHVLLNGSVPCEVSGTGAPLSTEEERLTLTAAIGAALPAGTYGSFMDTCRLASDDIEITHQTDTDGVAEVGLSFRAFRDERVAPDPVDTPIPIAAQVNEACGAPADEEAGCVIMPESGFWAEMTFDYTYDDPLLPISGAGINLSFYDADDNLLGNASSFSNPSTFTTSSDGLGHVTGQTFRMLTSVYPVNPFADQPGGRPAKITLQIQFGAFQVPNRPGGLHIRAFARWRLPDEADVTLYPTPHDAERADLFQIMSLWPVNVTFNF